MTDNNYLTTVSSGLSNIFPKAKSSPEIGSGWSITWSHVGVASYYILSTGAVVYSLFLLNGMIKSMTVEDRGASQETKKQLAKRLNRPEVETMEFDAHELKIIADIVGSDEISVSFKDIGGMDEELQEIQDNVVLPFRLWQLYKSPESIALCPIGVLLYGSPGTGKTLTAKAIAKESNATFINLKASTLLDKWLGESDKLVLAVFRLARKLAPTVVFIDEIDTLLRRRGDGGDAGGGAAAAIQSLQGLLLAEWDGLNSDRSASRNGESNGLLKAPVVILGATNRPTDLDKAFLRRLPLRIQTKVPNPEARIAIFKAQLQNDRLGEDVDLLRLNGLINGFTGSDIRELIRLAGTERTKYIIRNNDHLRLQVTSGKKNQKKEGEKGSGEGEQNGAMVSFSELRASRPLMQIDFEYAITRMLAEGVTSSEFGHTQLKQEIHDKLSRQQKAYKEAVEDLAAAENKV